MEVTDGVTVVAPVADADVKFPGEIEILVAPVVAQLKLLLAPDAMVLGAAKNEPITGFVGAVTATVTVAEDEPVASVAVSV